jgi:hypothetical protein
VRARRLVGQSQDDRPSPSRWPTHSTTAALTLTPSICSYTGGDDTRLSMIDLSACAAGRN